MPFPKMTEHYEGGNPEARIDSIRHHRVNCQVVEICELTARDSDAVHHLSVRIDQNTVL